MVPRRRSCLHDSFGDEGCEVTGCRLIPWCERELVSDQFLNSTMQDAVSAMSVQAKVLTQQIVPRVRGCKRNGCASMTHENAWGRNSSTVSSVSFVLA